MPFLRIIKDLTPPIIYRAAKSFLTGSAKHSNRLSGSYTQWQQAIDASSGYENSVILERTKATLLKVKKGLAVYERDSVLFEEVQITWPVLAGLMWAAARCGGSLNVLDFGGSLGSSYYQNRMFLNDLASVRWNIVEQAEYVRTGQEYFANDRLYFYSTMQDCLAATTPNVILLSSVLQYLEQPISILDEAFHLPCDVIILDRTPFWSGADDRIFVQVVPPEIYPASYPSWVFSKERFDEFLRRAGWETAAEFDALDHFEAPIDVRHQGAILVRAGAISLNQERAGQP